MNRTPIDRRSPAFPSLGPTIRGAVVCINAAPFIEHFVFRQEGRLSLVNSMSSQKRSYMLKARAEGQRRTRERIVRATMALHEEVGPARTTVAEVARRAAVQRLTVYNHFPEDENLFRACGGAPPPLPPPPRPSQAPAPAAPQGRQARVAEGRLGLGP